MLGGAVYYKTYELHVCSGSVVVFLQLALKGGVLFVEAVTLDRNNCEVTQINLPRAPNRTLSVSSSANFLFLFPSYLLSFPMYYFLVCFSSFPLTSSALILSCLLLIQPVCPLVNSSGLTLSYLTTNEQSGCAHSQRIRNPHGNPIILYHNTVLISLETTSFS